MDSVHEKSSIIQCTTPSQSNLSFERNAMDQSTIFEILHSPGNSGYLRPLRKNEFVLLFIECVGFFRPVLVICQI